MPRLINKPAKFLLFITACLLLHSSLLRAQTFSGLGGSIADNGTASYFQLNVSGLNPQNINTVFGLEKVCFSINHPYLYELRIQLIAPDGSFVTLCDANAYGNNFTSTCFSDFASTTIFKGSAPYTGQYRPIESIGYLNNGQNGNGSWKLRILDQSPYNNQGYLQHWNIVFGNNPGTPFPFTSSNLPLIFIDTEFEEIPDDPKIPVTFHIIDNGPGNMNHPGDNPVYTGHLGIELRGSSSQSFPKKSFGIETWDDSGNDLKVSLFGMPAETDWILNANFTDKTLMRNAMAYQIWQNMGYYATRYVFVELFINNRYKGIYVFSEKIKRDADRVNIAKMTETNNTGDAVTGGYIIKVDKQTGSGGDGWVSNYPPPQYPNGQYIYFQYEYPKAENITPQQKTYIQSYVDSFETALQGPGFANPVTGWRNYAVENTFFDYFIVNEFSKNVDGYRLSTFIHKQRNSLGGKLRMGPVWDYDLAWHNADYCGGDTFTGWAYQFPCPWDWWQVPFWWNRLLQDPTFANNLNCRWNFLRGNVLSNAHINNYIDSLALLLNEPQQRNFMVWDILGIYIWPNPWPYPTSYAGETASLKSWISNRFFWLDVNMPGTCTSLGSNNIANEESSAQLVFPNPATNYIYLDHNLKPGPETEIMIINMAGSVVMKIEQKSFSEDIRIDISRLAAGAYQVLLRANDRISRTRFIKLPAAE